MTSHIPAPPPWLDDLPRERRGFPIPAEAPWVDGAAVLAGGAADRKVALALKRACAVCGYRLAPERPVYRVWGQGDAAQIRLYERDRCHDLHGPGHRSCMIYSTFACPFLRESRARLGKGSRIAPGRPRGSRAAVMGFDYFALLIFNGPHDFLLDEDYTPYFMFENLVEDLPYKSPDLLLAELSIAVGKDAADIPNDQERNFWTDSDVDIQRMAGIIGPSARSLARSRAEYLVNLLGKPYAAFHMPVS